jgi:hypothetical protein
MCGRDTQRGQREEKIKNQIHGDSCMGGGWQEKRYVWGGGREEKIERKKIQIWACRNGVQILNQLVRRKCLYH